MPDMQGGRLRRLSSLREPGVKSTRPRATGAMAKGGYRSLTDVLLRAAVQVDRVDVSRPRNAVLS
jgi:hypothetical protein